MICVWEHKYLHLYSDLPSYLNKEEDDIRGVLEHFVALGKRLFLLSNSSYEFIDAG